jgi:hypothetical protein
MKPGPKPAAEAAGLVAAVVAGMAVVVVEAGVAAIAAVVVAAVAAAAASVNTKIAQNKKTQASSLRLYFTDHKFQNQNWTTQTLHSVCAE